MKLQFKLSFYDFLEYQLYFSSKSEVQQKNRKKSRNIVPLIYIGLIIIALIINQYIIAVTFFIAAILWYLFHPLYAKYRYKKHFEKHINENYKNRINKEATLNFIKESNVLEATDEGTKTSIKVSEFDKLIELKNHFFLRLKSEMSFVIPKHAIEDETEFKKLFLDLNIGYLDETDWVWK
ncbi:YcxB family protein [Winogradskyella litoriviva]|uniref:YcxB family protein n=1 Tax=Winogradskyella litoriviva TaxID=1220182 RepID=A0ABX2E3G1_9FLAO|nr:YcxB family protein [Winogradskyella litoriviva]NRD22506.1 YcxB family protein [Winogradskyella litoriviva]